MVPPPASLIQLRYPSSQELAPDPIRDLDKKQGSRAMSKHTYKQERSTAVNNGRALRLKWSRFERYILWLLLIIYIYWCNLIVQLKLFAEYNINRTNVHVIYTHTFGLSDETKTCVNIESKLQPALEHNRFWLSMSLKSNPSVTTKYTGGPMLR